MNDEAGLVKEESDHQPRRRIVTPWKDTVSGGFGGVCVILSGHPLDTVKVRLQTMPKVAAGETPLYTGMLDCIRKTVHSEGVKGLYKGMSAPLVGVVPIFAVSFMGFSVGKRLQQKSPDDQLNAAQLFAAGGLSGVFTTSVMAPGERIKCLLQVQQGSGKKLYNGPLDVVKSLYKTGGIKSIFRGTGATLLRDVPASGVYFLTYDWIKMVLSGGNTADLSLGATILGGGLAGVANWIVALPPDVMKSRLQSAPEGKYPNGVRSVFKEIRANEGFATLYRGFTPVMIRAFVANAACFVGYELCLWALNFGARKT